MELIDQEAPLEDLNDQSKLCQQSSFEQPIEHPLRGRIQVGQEGAGGKDHPNNDQ